MSNPIDLLNLNPNVVLFYSGSIEEDSDDCLIVYEEQDQYSTANFASYSAKIEETAQKSLDFLSIAEDQCKQNREMLSALGRQLNAMMPGKGMKKSISSLSITKQNDFSCKVFIFAFQLKFF